MKLLFTLLTVAMFSVASFRVFAGNPYDSIAKLHNECAEYLLDYLAKNEKPVTLTEFSNAVSGFAKAKGLQPKGSLDLNQYARYLKIPNDEVINRLEADEKISGELAGYVRQVISDIERFDENTTVEDVNAYVAEKENSLELSMADNDKALKFFSILKESTKLWLGSSSQNRCGFGCWACTIAADAVGILVFAGTNEVIDIIFQVLGGASVSTIARCCICGKCKDGSPCGVTIEVTEVR